MGFYLALNMLLGLNGGKYSLPIAEKFFHEFRSCSTSTGSEPAKIVQPSHRLATVQCFSDPWHLLNFSFAKKYVPKFDKLAVTKLRAMEQVNTSLSSISTVAHYDLRGISYSSM
jgi:hypothetical protein